MSRDFLPDARARRPTGDARFALHDGRIVPHVPVFCPSCGAPGGFVPVDTTTYAFWICDPCFHKYGKIAHTYAEPDVVFWERLREATRAEAADPMTLPQILDALSDPTSPLARLVADFEHGRIPIR